MTIVETLPDFVTKSSHRRAPTTNRRGVTYSADVYSDTSDDEDLLAGDFVPSIVPRESPITKILSDLETIDEASQSDDESVQERVQGLVSSPCGASTNVFAKLLGLESTQSEKFECDGDGDCVLVAGQETLPPNVTEIKTVQLCDSSLENCEEVEREEVYQTDTPPEDNTITVCDKGVCETVTNRTTVNHGEHSERKFGAITVIEPNPVIIKPYTMADTNLSNSVLSFVNAALETGKDTLRDQMGKWYLYGTDTCTYCDKAKKLLSDNNQTVVYINKDLSSEEQDAWINSFSSGEHKTVPVIILDNNLVGGYTELVQMLSTFKNDES